MNGPVRRPDPLAFEKSGLGSLSGRFSLAGGLLNAILCCECRRESGKSTL
jgi:hypothetical protein